MIQIKEAELACLVLGRLRDGRWQPAALSGMPPKSDGSPCGYDVSESRTKHMAQTTRVHKKGHFVHGRAAAPVEWNILSAHQKATSTKYSLMGHE